MIMKLWIAFANEESRLHKVITCNALRTWRHMPNYKVWKCNLCTPLFTAKAVCLQSRFHTSLYLSLFTSLQFQHFAFASVSLGWQSLLSHSPSSHLCLALSLCHTSLASLWSATLPCVKKYKTQYNAVIEFEYVEYEPAYVRTVQSIVSCHSTCWCAWGSLKLALTSNHTNSGH